MKVLCVIPARMGSTRFPGKPLKKILGIPMIERVYKNIYNSKLISKTIIATCDDEIYNFASSFGAPCLMTSNRHVRASDRCSEAVDILEKDYKESYEIILMVQGDEPLINTKMIDQSLLPFFNDKKIQVANLLGKINNEEEFNDPNCIKVVCDNFKNALFFSRQAIPTLKSPNYPFYGKQVCVIPFRRDFLKIYNQLSPTMHEQNESIDMLRILEHGFPVKMIPTSENTQAVDTLEDLQKVERIISNTEKIN